MTDSAPVPAAPVEYPKPEGPPLPPMPLWWRGAILGGVLACGGLAYTLQPTLGTRGQAGFGILCFLGVVAAFSRNLRGVSLKTFGWGIAIQFLLAAAVLYVEPVQWVFKQVGGGITVLIDCSNEGAVFVFGELGKGADGKLGFVFAFRALPPILFISAFFSVLYYFGILQLFPSNGAKLDFVQNLQYKYIDLVSLDLAGSSEDEVKESITFRYNIIKAKLSSLQNKFKQFSSIVKTKSPALMVQFQKSFKSGNTGPQVGHSKSWKPT